MFGIFHVRGNWRVLVFFYCLRENCQIGVDSTQRSFFILGLKIQTSTPIYMVVITELG